MLNIHYRTLLAFSHDVMASALAWFVAYWLRFNFDIPALYLQNFFQSLPWVILLQSLVFWSFGLYRGIWRYASLPDLKRIIMAVSLAALAVPVVLLFTLPVTPTPRSVLVLNPLLLMLIMGGSRVAYRAWKEHRLYGLLHQQGKPVLVLGAGEAAVSLLKELERSREWRVVGLLDDSVNKQGRLLQGMRVLGPLDSLSQWAEKLQVRHVIIAMPSASHHTRRRAVELCRAQNLDVLTVPSFEDLISGRVTVSQIRKVEVGDLLGREPVVLDSSGLNEWLCGRVVMVTGAGGSIGSELCRQIAKYKPKVIIMFELNEFALYTLEQEFSERFMETAFICAIGDVKNAKRLTRIIEQYAPSVVFHAAAYKHVPLMENENTWETIQNNVWGTYILADVATRLGVEKFVMVSTDKAVNPTNVMGASKRLAEMVCEMMQQKSSTRFVMVRFGNVLGSAGSVIPKFHEQISRGGPVTVTHPEITRYFMSIPEAAQLVLQAGLMGNGGEIFVMDMGEPVKIADLARDMIRLSGFTEDEIKIVCTGLRPGEKLYEELLADSEQTLATPHPKLRIAKARHVDTLQLDQILSWLNHDPYPEDSIVKRDLGKWVSEYTVQQ